jgi:SanA protein
MRGRAQGVEAGVNGWRLWRAWLRSWWVRGPLAVALALTLWLAFKAHRIESTVAPFITAKRADLPRLPVALVLGCSKLLPDGRKNLFFERRIEAATELFHGGQVRFLLVSGDNGRVGYDEPSDMRAALVAAGVPADRIVLDHAGFRTLDSVVRAKQVFGLERLIVVSQRFHNERAVYLARAHGVEAYGYDAKDVGGVEGLTVRLREVVSRLAAVLDVEVLHSSPRFGGPREAPLW